MLGPIQTKFWLRLNLIQGPLESKIDKEIKHEKDLGFQAQSIQHMLILMRAKIYEEIVPNTELPNAKKRKRRRPNQL